MTDEDRRQSHRVPFVTEVLCTIGEFSFTRRSIDISSEGMFIEDVQPPDNGEPIVVEFTLKGTPIRLRGQVKGRTPAIGFGVLIEEMEPGVRELIANHVLESISRLRRG